MFDNLVSAHGDLFEALELLDGKDGAKDFLTTDLHVVGHVGENGWLETK